MLRSGTIAVYSLEPPPGQVRRSKRSDRFSVPTLSHTSSLRDSLNTTASALATGRVQCLAWLLGSFLSAPSFADDPACRRTSDGYGLACGWSLGWSVWSVYGRLGSWSVAGSLDGGGYGVEGEKSDSFEDGFMMGVRALVRHRSATTMIAN